ncbi:hypothetical protein IFM89_023932 [Coptis chinensis]|uniref:IBR domain-containing protein n=1 Tax=Coptis chinensis TaxID=261450 RepID=A0A835M4Q8_9MAGN|nr:hypothetical protein IFM89_023932 [Coptis chinensis]
MNNNNCLRVLELEFCWSILPKEVLDRWRNTLYEQLIVLGTQKFYYPYKNCMVLLIDDDGVVVKESECPHCRRMFCAQCKNSRRNSSLQMASMKQKKADEKVLKLAEDQKASF